MTRSQQAARRVTGIILCLALALSCGVGLAVDQPEALTVDGIDAFQTPSGEHWSYDAQNKVLRLDGYEGGPIVAHCDLTVELAAGSANTITAVSGTALGNGTSFGSPYTLTLRGEAGGALPSLDVTGVNHAIHAVGDLRIQNCSLTARNTAPSATPGDSGKMECVQSEDDIVVTSSTLHLTSNGPGLTCFDNITIQDSDVTVRSAMAGIYANNQDLTIVHSTLDVSGTQLSALQSLFGNVSLEDCSGTLTSGTVGVTVQNQAKGAQCDVTMVGCDFTVQAPYGVLAYGNIVVKDGSLAFPNSMLGLFAYTDNPGVYTGEAYLKGQADIQAAQAAVQTSGGLYRDVTTQLTGSVKAAGGVEYRISNDLDLSTDYAVPSGQSFRIAAGATLTVPKGATLDASQASSVLIQGALVNQGTVLLPDDTANQGNMDNQGVITAPAGVAVANTGKIVSRCDAAFPVTGTDLVLEHDWDGGAVTRPSTANQEGVKTYTCRRDSGHTYTEALLRLADYTRVEAALSRAQALQKEDYVDFSAVTAAMQGVVRELDVSRQAEVDAMADALLSALDNLERRPTATGQPTPRPSVAVQPTPTALPTATPGPQPRTGDPRTAAWGWAAVLALSAAVAAGIVRTRARRA
jgi:hypothetical protein